MSELTTYTVVDRQGDRAPVSGLSKLQALSAMLDMQEMTFSIEPHEDDEGWRLWIARNNHPDKRERTWVVSYVANEGDAAAQIADKAISGGGNAHSRFGGDRYDCMSDAQYYAETAELAAALDEEG